jgi:hypothetical protein
MKESCDFECKYKIFDIFQGNKMKNNDKIQGNKSADYDKNQGIKY